MPEPTWTCDQCGWTNVNERLQCSNCSYTKPKQRNPGRIEQSAVKAGSPVWTWVKEKVLIPTRQNVIANLLALAVLLVFICGIAVIAAVMDASPPLALAIVVGVAFVVDAGRRRIKETLTVCTGSVSFRQHDLGAYNVARHFDQSSMPVQSLGKSRFSVFFRVEEFDSLGNQKREIAVEQWIHNQDVYVQEGDLVTVAGRGEAASHLVNPVVANHTSQTITNMPKSRLKSFWWWLLLMGLVVCYFRESTFFGLRAEPGSGAKQGFAALLLYIFGLALVAMLSSRSFAQKIKRELATQGAVPQRVLLNSPGGIVEGVTTFARTKHGGTRNQTDEMWVIFRMAIYDSSGQVAHRLVGSMPFKELRVPLRVGEYLQWTGEYRTGKISRSPFVKIGSLANAGTV